MKRWRVLLPTLLISGLVYSSCSSWRQNEREFVWDARSHIESSNKVCRAKVKAAFKADDLDEQSDAEFRFEWNQKKSTLDLRLLSPFHSTLAQVKVSEQKSVWIDQEGEYPLSGHPILKRWLSPDWWWEVGFLFGLLSKGSKASISTNQYQQPIFFRNNKRVIHCRYADETSNYPELCTIEDTGLSMRFDFTFIECHSQL